MIVEKKLSIRFFRLLCVFGFLVSKMSFGDEIPEPQSSGMPSILGNQFQVDDKKIEELQKKGFVGPGGKPITKKDFENYKSLMNRIKEQRAQGVGPFARPSQGEDINQDDEVSQALQGGSVEEVPSEADLPQKEKLEKPTPESSFQNLPIPHDLPRDNLNSTKKQSTQSSPSDFVPPGKEFVSIDFPNGVLLKDIIRTVSSWTGKNFILAQGVSGSIRLTILSPEKVTKEEAYQAFLSALNIAGYTTVDTGKVVKILPLTTARSSNVKTFYGSKWAPATDEIITQIIPLHFTTASAALTQLRAILGSAQALAFDTTNSIIITDTGNHIRRFLEILQLLDTKVNQPQVSILPIHHMDASIAAKKVEEIFGSQAGKSLYLQKLSVDERTNSLILVGLPKGLDDVVRFVHRLDKPVADMSSQNQIHIRPLSYATAEKLAETLNNLTQAGSSNKTPYNPYFPPHLNKTKATDNKNTISADLGDTKITADKSTNSIIVQGSRAAFIELDKIIAQLDKRKSQVFVESKIVDMNMTDTFDWGTSFGGASNVLNSKAMIPFGNNLQNSIPLLTGDPKKGLNNKSLGQGLLFGILGKTAIEFGDLKLSPGALLFALESNSNTNVLQTPSMLVSDNEEAKFKVNEQRFITTTSNSPSGLTNDLKTINAITALTITPHIGVKHFVNMKIDMQLDDTAGKITSESQATDYTVFERTASTNLSVQNGQTIVIGGLTKEKDTITESQIPLLGDIPLIGWLFKNDNKRKDKQNLMLFITPYIIRNSEDMALVYEKKIRDRDEFLKAFYGKKYKSNDLYKKLPTLEEGMAPVDIHDEQGEDDKNQYKSKNSTSIKRKSVTLPSQETDPINAPAHGGSSSSSRFFSPSRSMGFGSPKGSYNRGSSSSTRRSSGSTRR